MTPHTSHASDLGREAVLRDTPAVLASIRRAAERASRARLDLHHDGSVLGSMQVQSFRAILTSRWVSMVLAVALTLSFGIASMGVMPSADQVAEWLDFTESEQFPCGGGHCGCATAHECWTSCCCTTAVQRLEWALRRGVMPPAYARFADSDWIAAANRVAPGSATCAACVARIQADLRDGIALAGTFCGSTPAGDCCGKNRAQSDPCAGASASKAEVQAPASASCCAERRDASRTLPSLSPLGCKGRSPLISLSPPPVISSLCFTGLLLQWSRIDLVLIDDMYADSRALDACAPPPKRTATAS